VSNPNPHIADAQKVVSEAREMSEQGSPWQKILLTLQHAQVEATLAVALELQVKNGGGVYAGDPG
jgi:hypothetical protein